MGLGLVAEDKEMSYSWHSKYASQAKRQKIEFVLIQTSHNKQASSEFIYIVEYFHYIP